MNILIVDKSEVFSLGLKNFILKLQVFINSNSIEISNELSIEHSVLNSLDILFVDYVFLELPTNIELIKKHKKSNSNLKIVISSNLITKINFNLLLDIQPNGFFSKSISQIDFKIYIKKMLSQVYYIDFESISKQVKSELDNNDRFTKKFQQIYCLNLINDFEVKMNMSHF
jgi:DNA-binding NarL/FixJ family response regulator